MTPVPVFGSTRLRFGIRRAGPWVAVLAAIAATAVAGYLEFGARYNPSFIVTLSTALFLGTGILLIGQHRRDDGALALLAGLLLVPQGLTVPLAGLPDSGWTRPLDLAFVVPATALVLRVPSGRLTTGYRVVVGVLAAVLVVAPAVAVAAGSTAPRTAEAVATMGTLVGTAVLVAVASLRGDRVSRQARVPLAAVAVGMMLFGALQVYGETFGDDPAPLPWTDVLGLQGPRDFRDFCAAMIPVALVAEAIRRAEARADVGRRVVAGARLAGVEGVRAALRSGLREPEVDLLPPGADVGGAADKASAGRRRIALEAHDGAPLGVVDVPDADLDPLVLDASLAAARVGLEHADAVVRLQAQIGDLELSRSEFLSTVERERRRLKAQLSSGLQAPLQGLAGVLAEASEALANGDEGRARRLLVAARARLAVAHADLRLLARGVDPAGAQPVRSRSRPARPRGGRARTAARGRLAGGRSETQEPGGRGRRVLRRCRGRTHRREHA